MSPISPELNRRDLLKKMAIAASASSFSLGTFAFSIQENNEEEVRLFLSLSSVLTGLELDLSYWQLSQDILWLLKLNHTFHLEYQSLMQRFNTSSTLALNPQVLAQSHPSSVKAILKAWYMSQVSLSARDAAHPKVQQLCPNLRYEAVDITRGETDLTERIGQISYDEALCWQACYFTKPAATCGGPFGYWSDAPE